MSVRFESPLRNLCDVLTQIRDSAKQYQSTLKASEASTRAVLIDPILRALGWDTANTHMVEIEKSLGSVRADYVLSDVNREPKIIVEAKALGTGLDEKKLLLSLVQYAFQFELTEVFLTDGLAAHAPAVQLEPHAEVLETDPPRWQSTDHKSAPFAARPGGACVIDITW